MANLSTQLYIPGNVDLSTISLNLRSKAPDETVGYTIDLHARMDSADRISTATVSSNDSTVAFSNVEALGSHIILDIAGGTINTLCAVHVSYTTMLGDVRELTVGLWIAPQGLQSVSPPVAMMVAPAISSAAFASAMISWMATLPNTQPEAGGAWLDGGLVAYSPAAQD